MYSYNIDIIQYNLYERNSIFFNNIKYKQEMIMWDPCADFKKKTFDNGLDVYLLQWSGVSWVRAGFVIHSGASQDAVGREGTAHFVEHVVSENLSVTSEDLIMFFKSVGGRINLGITDYMHTQYDFFVPTDMELLIQGFEYMSEMLVGNTLEQYIERERSVILSEFFGEYPIQVLANHFLQQKKKCYKDVFLSRFLSTAGNCETIPKITMEDIQRYYNLFYVPSNMSVVLIGDISWEDIDVLLQNTHFVQGYGGCHKKLSSRTKNIQSQHKDSMDCSKSVFVYSENGIEGIEQISYHSMTQLSKYHNLSALDIFSSMLNQVLYIQIREKLSITYEFYTQFYCYHDFTEFSIRGNLDGNFEENIDDYVQLCIVSLMGDKKLFEATKNGIMNEMCLLDVNGRDVLYSVIGEIVSSHRTKSLQEEIEEMKQVKFEDVVYICEELKKGNRHIYMQIP